MSALRLTPLGSALSLASQTLGPLAFVGKVYLGYESLKVRSIKCAVPRSAVSPLGDGISILHRRRGGIHSKRWNNQKFIASVCGRIFVSPPNKTLYTWNKMLWSVISKGRAENKPSFHLREVCQFEHCMSDVTAS